MKVLKKVWKTTLSMAVIGMLIAAPAFAQAGAASQTPPAQPPPVQKPPAQPPTGQKPAAPAIGQPPAPAPQAQPPKPFPEGAKVAYLDIQLIASSSVEGRSASAKIQEWEKKKTAELAERTKQAQALQTKLQQGGNVLSDSARAQSEKELQKLQRELQGLQEDAQQERSDLTAQLQAEFQEKLNPIIEQVATEKNLQMVFSVRDSGVVWAYNGVDLSAEVIKRFDAAMKAAPKK
ncbi:MAG: OmpH family outer membrane protein [Acidobacteria bacterium]|nr:OmpH family outer membrane protein [Acidobacteriota bacterium]